MTATGKTALLEVENLSKRYNMRQGLFARSGPSLTAIDRVSFSIEPGQIFGLVGESGSGKSTLGRVILQLVRPDSGKVIFKGKNLCAASKLELREAREKLQVVFQDASAALSPRRSILQTLLEPLDQFAIGDRSGRLQKCEEVLDTVGLDRDVLARLPHQLSSGQRQRIGIARAVLTDPDLIIADEAVSALDVSVQAQILELIRKLQSERGIAFLFISHDLAVIPQLADVVAVMFQGQLVESAPIESLFRNPSHPYTKELLAAIPDPDPTVSISPVHVTAGLSRASSTHACVFADRCRQVMPRCKEIEPQTLFLQSDLTHRVKCHLYSEQGTDHPGEKQASTK